MIQEREIAMPGIGESIQVSCAACDRAFVLRVPGILDAQADRGLIDSLADGSLFRTPCPHCHAPADLDFPVLVCFPDRALPIWFVPALGTDNEADTRDFRRLLDRFRDTRPDQWDEAWRQLFWVTGRAEFRAVAVQRRFAAAAGRVHLSSIVRFRRAETDDQLRDALAGHPPLLEDDVQELLDEIIDQHWLRRDEGGAADYEADRALLRSMREIGVEPTFAELDRRVSPALTVLHEAADEATERSVREPSDVSLAAREQSYSQILAHPEFAQSPKGFAWRILYGRALTNHDWFEHGGNVDRLDRAIADIEQALERMPLLAERERARLLNSLGKWRIDRYERHNDRRDLDLAISAFQEAYALAPKADPHSLMVVGNLGRGLRDRFSASADATDLDRSAALLDEAYNTARMFNQLSSIAPALNSLGITLQLRYESRGDPADLRRAIWAFTEACGNHQDDVALLRRAAANLARALRTKYEREGSLSDLDQAIEILRRLAGSNEGVDRGSILLSLGGVCLVRYARTSDRADLDAALAAFERSVAESPSPRHVAGLAQGRLTRYQVDGDLRDLKEALTLLGHVVAADPSPAHHAQAGRACELAFERNGERTWIDQAIDHFQEAHDALGLDDPMMPAALYQLGSAIATRFRRFAEPRDATRADRHLDQACQTGLQRAPRQAFAAGLFWGEWSVERAAWDAAGRAFNYAGRAAHRLLRAQPDRQAKAVLLKASQGLATARAHCLARMGRPEDAVSALEAGRTQLRDEASTVSQQALNRLVATGEGILAQRYRDLREEIAEAETGGAGAEQIAALQASLGSTVARIDQLLDLDEQRNTASVADVAALTRGPRPRSIVYLATYREATLALIVAHGRVRAAWLPLDASTLDHLLLTRKPNDALTAEETAALNVERRTFSLYGTTDALVHGYSPRAPDAFQQIDRPWSRERYLEVGAVTGGWLAAQRGHAPYRDVLDAVIPTLWSQVMQPLGVELAAAAREPATILVPCGELALLPLHAAWEQSAAAGDPQRVFSYIPAARMLQSAAPPASDTLPAGRFLGVGNAQADTAPLDYAELEIAVCGAVAGAPPDMLRLRGAATHDEVAARMREATLLHFACHGRFDAADPMASAVYLADGVPLPLGEVRRIRLPHAPLVILSACETAITDTRFLPDEALGLATGFLDAGARGVVCTLWPVNDVSTMLLMEQFYLHHVRDRRPAADALGDARQALRTLRAGDISTRLDALRGTFSKGHPLASAVIRQYRRYVAMKPDERPFSHPYYWAGFTYTGT